MFTKKKNLLDLECLYVPERLVPSIIQSVHLISFSEILSFSVLRSYREIDRE